MDQKIQFCKDVNSPVLIQIQCSFGQNTHRLYFSFVKHDKLFIWQCKGPRITTIFLKTKNKVQEIAIQAKDLEKYSN